MKRINPKNRITALAAALVMSIGFQTSPPPSAKRFPASESMADPDLFGAEEAPEENDYDEGLIGAPHNAVWHRSAIGVHISPLGQQYIYENSNRILEKNGLKLTSAKFPLFSYKMDEPLTERNIKKLLSDRMSAGDAAEIAKAFEEIQKTIKRWVEGYELKDPQFHVKALNAAYAVKVKRLGVRIDEEKTRALGGRGVVLVAELECPELKLTIPKVRAKDLRNSWLGQFGLNNLGVSYRSETTPLRVQMPVEVSVDGDHGLVVKARTVITNLDKLKLTTTKPGLVMPKVELSIGTGPHVQTSTLDTSEIEAMVGQYYKELVKSLQTFGKNYARDDAAGLINKQLKKALASIDVDTVTGMGGQKLMWGVRPARVESRYGSLYIEAEGMIEDPAIGAGFQRPNYSVFKNKIPSSTWNGAWEPDNGQHAMLSVHQDLLNRALQHTWNRGGLKTIEMFDDKCKATVLNLKSPPALVLLTARPNTAVLRLDVTTVIEDFNFNTVRNDTLHFQFDLIVRFDLKSGRLAIVKDSIDAGSVWVDPASLRDRNNMAGDMVINLVKKKLREKLAVASQDFKKNYSPLLDTMGEPRRDSSGREIVNQCTKAVSRDGTVGLPTHLAHIPLKVSSVRSFDGYLQIDLGFSAIR